MKRWCVVALLLFVAGVPGLLAGCGGGSASRLEVVASTSLMGYIAEQVGQEHVEVLVMVPPNQHPGNFDVKPGDIEKLAKADLFLLHGWPGEGYADKLISSANNPQLKVLKANINGNWMIPSVQAAATDWVASALSQADARNASAYQSAAATYKKEIAAKEAAVKDRLAKAHASGAKVIASARQADFLQWAGFNVVATFQNAQTLTPQVVKDLVDKGKAAGVVMIVNNIQDGQDAGKAVAQELGAQNVNLSNFPGGLPNTETWEKAIDRNVDILVAALSGVAVAGSGG